MRDWDDDKKVESHSEHRDGGKHNVKEHSLRPMNCGPLAGRVEELWKAELRSILGLHLQRSAESCSSGSFLSKTESCNWFISLTFSSFTHSSFSQCLLDAPPPLLCTSSFSLHPSLPASLSSCFHFFDLPPCSLCRIVWVFRARARTVRGPYWNWRNSSYYYDKSKSLIWRPKHI